ncbi:MAG: DUF4349 domain-containing protein [Candidatus Zipacnadales bacterium]
MIYTAEMTVEVDDVEAATATIEKLIKSAKSWLASKTVQAHEEVYRTTTITLRVPAQSFDHVMAQLRQLGKVLSENITAEDVTKQVLDLEARLKNLRREEEVVLELFRREGKIESILQVERELSRIRGEIEQAQSTLNYLRENVAYSTITITLKPKPTGVEQKIDEWGLGWHTRRAWRTLVLVVRALVLALLYGAIVVGPFVVAALIIWRIVRHISRTRRQMPSERNPTERL